MHQFSANAEDCFTVKVTYNLEQTLTQDRKDGIHCLNMRIVAAASRKFPSLQAVGGFVVENAETTLCSDDSVVDFLVQRMRDSQRKTLIIIVDELLKAFPDRESVSAVLSHLASLAIKIFQKSGAVCIPIITSLNYSSVEAAASTSNRPVLWVHWAFSYEDACSLLSSYAVPEEMHRYFWSVCGCHPRSLVLSALQFKRDQTACVPRGGSVMHFLRPPPIPPSW